MDWSSFEALPGDSRRNFELVTRAAVRNAYGRYGRLCGTRQQPGVEYYLKLDRPSPIGDPPRTFGWQCRFYDDEGYLDTKRRTRIEAALEKAIKHVYGLTDFVLWTKLPLRRQDGDWLQRRSTARVTCHTWHEGDLDTLLMEHAPSLKEAFFGELVVTPDQLARRYDDAVDHVADRFDASLHVEGGELRVLRRSLGTPELWGHPLVHAERPGTTRSVLARLKRHNQWLANDEIRVLTRSVRTRSAIGEAAPRLIADGRFTDLLDQIAALPPPLGEHCLSAAVQAARDGDDERGVNMLSWLWDVESTAEQKLSDAVEALGPSMIAVVGGAGVGKTHLAATLAERDGDRPPGVLVLGKRFGATLDAAQLAETLVPATSSLERALDALQAAAERSCRRLPIVIDGINESDDPFAWRPLLTDLRRQVERRPNLLVVVTVRSDYAERCLPIGVPEIELAGFDRWQAQEAVERYFDAYRIELDAASLPWLSFEHPLFLRIFCEATNPERARTVAVTDVPEGQAAVVELFIERVLERIGERQPQRDLDDARGRVAGIALRLWHDGRRSLLQREVKALCGDPTDRWDATLTQQLLSEGLLRRDPPPAGRLDRTRQEISFVFDLVAGHAIASALIAEGETDLTDAALADRLLVGRTATHPLAQDVVIGLETTLARAGRAALWQVTASPALRREALLRHAEQPARHVTAEAVVALEEAIRDDPGELARLLRRALKVHDVRDDPFNAAWLDRMLRPLAVWQRDLIWTEWVRRHQSAVLDALRRHWPELEQPSRSPKDLELPASFFGWCLTSTVRGLRDEATALLVQFGLESPSVVFELAASRLDVNDPYVVERCMAVVYGVFMRNVFPSEPFLEAAPGLLDRLHTRVVASDADCPTSHWLTRSHVSGILTFTRTFAPDLLSEPLRATPLVLPIAPHTPARMSEDHADRKEAEGMLDVDFERHTIGLLSRGRTQHDDARARHRQAVGDVLGRAWDLGWRAHRFGRVDYEIADAVERYELDPGREERYGAKYVWIGFYEAAGRMDAADQLVDELSGRRLRLDAMQLDPSFPAEPPQLDVSIPQWPHDPAEDDERWLRDVEVIVPAALLRVPDKGACVQWLCAFGEIAQEHGYEPERRVVAFIRMVLVPRGRWRYVAEQLEPVGQAALLDAASDYYTFAGEIPWAEHFAQEARSADGIVELRLASGETVTAEILAHRFAWGSQHSVMNDAGPAYVPSWGFSRYFGLRTAPGELDQCMPTGELAAGSRAAPEHSQGKLLYLREDLVSRYARERDKELGIVIWGEKSLHYERSDAEPAWYAEAVRGGANRHRTAVSLDQLCD